MAWSLGLDAWIVQDGNYADFRVGERVELALELWSADGFAASDGRPGAVHRVGSTYDVIGRAEARTDDAWVLDFGLLAYCEDENQPSVGAIVAGRANLNVDYYVYSEQLHEDPGFPALVYTWRIDRILIDVRPWIVVVERTYARADVRAEYREVETTNAWQDDGGYASYVLECTLLDEPAKRTSTTFIY